MSLFLLDDQGETWRGDSRQLRIAFDTPFSGGEFIEYAVKNLGFVAINVYGASCQIRLRPTFVGAKSLVALRNWLARSKSERVVWSTFDDEWQSELVPASSLEARLDQVTQEQQSDQLQPSRPADFLASPMSEDMIMSRRLLTDILASWPHLVANYPAETLVRLVGAAFDQHHVVVKPSKSLGKLVFQEFGEHMFTQYDLWRMCAVGAPLEEHPDRTYGRWIAQIYRDSIGMPAPRLDTVDAIVRCPIRGRMRFRYRRAIFPLQSASSDVAFVAASFEDRAIDLRVPSR